MSRDLLLYSIGRNSLVTAQEALAETLGGWARILPYLDNLSCRAELELVFSIDHILGREPRLTPPIKASLASDYVSSSRKILVSDAELMLMGETRVEAEEEE